MDIDRPNDQVTPCRRSPPPKGWQRHFSRLTDSGTPAPPPPISVPLTYSHRPAPRTLKPRGAFFDSSALSEGVVAVPRGTLLQFGQPDSGLARLAGGLSSVTKPRQHPDAPPFDSGVDGRSGWRPRPSTLLVLACHDRPQSGVADAPARTRVTGLAFEDSATAGDRTRLVSASTLVRGRKTYGGETGGSVDPVV